MKVYLAGSITDDPDYKNKFYEAEEYLKSIGMYGVEPKTVLPARMPYEDYSSICFAMIDVADCMAVIDGIGTSNGVHMEIDYILKNNIDTYVYTFDEFKKQHEKVLLLMTRLAKQINTISKKYTQLIYSMIKDIGNEERIDDKI